MLLQRDIFGDLTCRRQKKIGPGAGLRGPHLVPLCPKTYARSFPRVGIVRFRALAFTALNQPSLLVGKLEAKSSEAKEDWARGGCAGASFGPPLPRDLCQIISNSRDCALSRTCIGPPLPRDLCQIISKSWDCALSRTCIHRLKSTVPTLFEVGFHRDCVR
jgi:hypothetical protein